MSRGKKQGEKAIKIKSNARYFEESEKLVIIIQIEKKNMPIIVVDKTLRNAGLE